MRRLSRLLACLCLVPLIAAAPDTFTRADLEALEAQKKEAEESLTLLKSQGETAVVDLRALDETLLTTALEARRREEQATRAETSLIALRARREDARTALLAGEATLEDLLAALAAANRRRPPALIVSPGNSNVAIRRAILLQATYPQLSDRAAASAKEIAELNALEAGITDEQARLETAEAMIALKTEEIERLASSKRAAVEGLNGDLGELRARADRLSKEAGTLRELLAALESRAPDAPRLKPSAKPKTVTGTTRAAAPKAAVAKTVVKPKTPALGKSALGGLKQPVAGTLLHGFGDLLPGGSKSEFLVFQTRSEAQVTAPVGGSVEFARAFRSYGKMLIVRTSDGYDVILSGMSDIYVSEGQTVKAGEPVGRMPKRNDPLPELSVELRLGDRVLNPAQWMPGGE
jgi:murein hydrolase activator